ncbi:UvrD/REP helicase [Haloterrigena turkmenica DSM 5511]|uniref:DNA 3'-5' helicase n=1 Tax=Haloterrigena turkmenica (strain ATCC 51198 / DSM 5511 / JCM 9101 / NCIMB 13204 / VKM B-1734 / 4k) TaxID=543526 RepID=D2RZN2_HALTV|nr:ATP-dependent DNA helicase [Haloterrigena turkmenica]ADB62071.1 UvrD/REP helicase [Haloterrigena turkmenica DSM 5511]
MAEDEDARGPRSDAEETAGSSVADALSALEPKGNQRAVIESRADCTSVDAGAGTGKTTTMLMRIERAIERGEVDPDDVLVLTFANEAAGSIREAVAERLDPAAAAAIDVYTYHSFCYRLVRDYAYYLGYSPEFDVVTERKRRRIVGRLLATNDYGFATATRGDGSPDDLTAAVDDFIQSMSQEDVTPDELRERLPEVRTLELCNEFVLWLERTAGQDLSFDNEALRYFNADDHLEESRSSLVEYGKLLEYCREKIAEAPEPFREDAVVRDIDRYLRVMQDTVTNAIEALSLEDRMTKQLPRALFGNEIWRTATERIEQSPFGRLKHYVEFLRLARHYTDVYADYHDALAEEGALDFDELVRTATGLLEDGAEHRSADGSNGSATRETIADEITGEWTQVYCDEFQDTDETQFALITELTDGPDRPDLLAIGDKDQAIYGWRGTDREGLDRLADAYDDHRGIELELNFRSRQEILDLTNHCDYGSQSSKRLREVGRTPGEYRTDSDATAGRETGFETDEDRPDRVVKIESDAVGPSPADQVATTVSRLLNGEAENVPRRSLEDIAVIVRTNRHAQAVADELRERRIPYEISGSPRGEIDPGIRTLVSYLRVLVDPDADAHLRRVLLYRYRLSEADLATLQRADGSLYDAVMAVGPDAEVESTALEDPDRVRRARDHLAKLEDVRDVYPLSGFVQRFREVTRLEWFLTSEEREELERVERFVDAYTGDSVIGTLTPSFVDALERTLQGGGSERTRGTQSADSIDVMTVHQAKGLEFDTVLVPYLSDEEWCVERDYAQRARYRLLAATLDDEIESPLLADLATETVGEEWRVLHVALTRAENHLFVFGSVYDYDGDEDELGCATADACLSGDIEWSVAGERMELWSSLRASFERVRETYPETVVDRTDELAAAASVDPGTITYYAGYDDRYVEPLETRDAIRTVHRLGRLLRGETLLPAADAASHALEAFGRFGTDRGDEGDAAAEIGEADSTRRVPTGRRLSALTTDTVRFPVETLSNATTLPVALRHSYTALETHDTCPRKHYLDHVVRAFDDPTAGVGGTTARPETDAATATDSPLESGSRLVGTVFHDVAEEAFYREYRTREAWREAAVRQLTARDLLEYREGVLGCIDRFFEAAAADYDAPVADWEPVAAELPFSLEDVADVTGDVVGYIDSIRRTPDGELAVLDYKATAERIAPADATQLALYARACERRFDEPVAAVGYVYVSEAVGPRVDLLDADELPPWPTVRERLAAVDDPSFVETTPGDHCQYCPHRSLGCGPDDLETLGDD